MPSLLKHPQVYDVIQASLGYRITARRLRAALADTAGQTVLDVGAGTGNLAALLPPRATYVALEPDPEKRRRLVERAPHARVLNQVASATGLPDDAVDIAVCVAVSHHLDDGELRAAVDEIARVARRLVFCDAVWDARWPVGRLLWALDRGEHPRPRTALVAALERRFRLDQRSDYRAVHKYFFCTGTRSAPHV